MYSNCVFYFIVRPAGYAIDLEAYCVLEHTLRLNEFVSGFEAGSVEDFVRFERDAKETRVG